MSICETLSGKSVESFATPRRSPRTEPTPLSRPRLATPRVALLIEGSNGYARGLLQGVSDFLQANTPWSIYFPEATRGEGAAEQLRQWKGDGVIVRVENAATAAAAVKCNCPVVNLSASNFLPGVPTVHSDQRAEADQAFNHLWERGFRNLAFCGVSDYVWANWQMKRFVECATASGVEVHAHLAPLHLNQPKAWASGREKLIKWLRDLPKPIGILACYDLLGQEIVNVCQEAGLRVPEDVAVVGVDDDPVRCSLSDPGLSSVAPDTRRIGHIAAELLSTMMAGKKVDVGLRNVAPLGVVARGSTDALAVRDPDIAAALKYIRAHACEPFGVKNLLDVIPLSRRALEARFIKVLGRTPHEQILLCRVERAKQLLHDTDLPIKTIANMVGTGTPEYLSVLFRRIVGSSPSEYREAHNTSAARNQAGAVAIES
jgi:LacI family transcriptional regulator